MLSRRTSFRALDPGSTIAIDEPGNFCSLTLDPARVRIEVAPLIAATRHDLTDPTGGESVPLRCS
jgi:hypothetical protein